MKDTRSIWNIHTDLELLLTEFEKIDYLTNTIFETLETIDYEKTENTKAQMVLGLSESRKDLTICTSLLMDTTDRIRNDLSAIAENILNLYNKEKATEK